MAAGSRRLFASILLILLLPAAFAGEAEAPRRIPARLFAFPVQPSAPAAEAPAPIAPAARPSAPAQPPAAAPLPAVARAPAPAVPPLPVVSAMLPLPESGSIPVLVGRSQIVKLPNPASRVAVSDPRIADYVMVAPNQLYVYGKAVGATNLLIWNKDEDLRKVDITVDVDLAPLRKTYADLLPKETDIRVNSVGGALVLSGSVSDVIVAEHAINFAEAFSRNLQKTLSGAGSEGGTGAGVASSVKVINTLRIRDPQQVMLEVRIAEVSKNLLKSIGAGIDGGGKAGDLGWNLASGFLDPKSVLAALLFRGKGVEVSASKDNGVFRILAEPTIVAVSGEEASFLAGGRLLLPVNQGSGTGASSAVTLQERDFGVGLKFKPVVLDDGRISLRVSPEVTELGTTALQVSGANGSTTSAIPSFTLRRVSTAVQMKDGQSLIIAGLLKNNLKDSVKSVPGLSDVPILGALFRSSSYQADLTELVVVVTPRLVRATDGPPPLPTDRFAAPTERELFGEGKIEQTVGNP